MESKIIEMINKDEYSFTDFDKAIIKVGLSSLCSSMSNAISYSETEFDISDRVSIDALVADSLYNSWVGESVLRVNDRKSKESDCVSTLVSMWDFLMQDYELIKREFFISKNSRADILAKHKGSGKLLVLEAKFASARIEGKAEDQINRYKSEMLDLHGESVDTLLIGDTLDYINGVSCNWRDLGIYGKYALPTECMDEDLLMGISIDMNIKPIIVDYHPVGILNAYHVKVIEEFKKNYLE